MAGWKKNRVERQKVTFCRWPPTKRGSKGVRAKRWVILCPYPKVMGGKWGGQSEGAILRGVFGIKKIVGELKKKKKKKKKDKYESLPHPNCGQKCGPLFVRRGIKLWWTFCWRTKRGISHGEGSSGQNRRRQRLWGGYKKKATPSF